MMAHQAPAGGATSSSLYGVLPEHTTGLLAVAAVPFVMWWLDQRHPQAVSANRLVLWLLTTTAAVHAGLVIGHEWSIFTVLYAIDAGAIALVVRQVVLGRRWRLAAGLVLVAGILAYSVSMVAGHPPDQVGLATKLVELGALAIVLRPERQPAALRRLMGSAATVALVVVTGIASWVGAIVAAESATGGHHDGAMPFPSVVVGDHEDRPPTPAERAAAEALHARAAETLASYADPAVAAVAGYRVEGIMGDDFHAPNPAYQDDGRIFDPERPENLIYAETDRGPVLLGAMFEMPTIGVPGPAIGGPLTVWHEHENVCVTLLPPALSGLLSPFGMCPIGSVLLPRTPEMLHMWVVPGAPQFGDIDEERRADYLETVSSP